LRANTVDLNTFLFYTQEKPSITIYGILPISPKNAWVKNLGVKIGLKRELLAVLTGLIAPPIGQGMPVFLLECEY